MASVIFMKYNNPRQLLSHETTWWDFKWKNSPNIFAFFFSAEMLTLQSWPVLVLSHPLPAHDKVKASQMLTVAKMYLWYYCGIYPVCAWGQTCPSGPGSRYGSVDSIEVSSIWFHIPQKTEYLSCSGSTDFPLSLLLNAAGFLSSYRRFGVELTNG